MIKQITALEAIVTAQAQQIATLIATNGDLQKRLEASDATRTEDKLLDIAGALVEDQREQRRFFARYGT